MNDRLPFPDNTEVWKEMDEKFDKTKKEWALQRVKGVIEEIRKKLEHLDEERELREVINNGMLSSDEKGLPIFTEEGKDLVSLLREASDQIVSNIASFEEMENQAAYLLTLVESIAVNSLFKFPEATLQKIAKIQTEIVKESIGNFKNAFGDSILRKKDKQSEKVFKQAIEQASEPANKRAAEIIKAVHPEMSESEISERLKKLGQANVHDIFAVSKFLMKNNSDEKLDMKVLLKELRKKENMAWLPREKRAQMRSLYYKSIDAETTLSDEEIKDFALLLETVHLSWAASQFPRQLAGENRFTRDAYQQFPAIKVSFTQKGGYPLTVLEIMKDFVHMDIANNEEEEKDSDIVFFEALDDAVEGYDLPVISKDEMLVPSNYEYVVTEEDIQRMCEGKPYDEHYTKRIKWTDEEIAQWDSEGRPHEKLPKECIIDAHPNKLDGIKKGWTVPNKEPNMVNPLTGKNYETDSEGHPLHPHWREMLKYGIPAGSGFYFNEGNGGNIDGLPSAQDPFILRFKKINNEIYLQVLVGVRTDDVDGKYAFLGGMKDKSDVENKGYSGNAVKKLQELTNVREAGEEGNINLQEAPFLRIFEAEVVDPRSTLNAHITTGVTAFFLDNDTEITPNTSEMLKIEWVNVSQDLLGPKGMFASHGKLLAHSLRYIYDETGYAPDKKGQLSKVA